MSLTLGGSKDKKKSTETSKFTQSNTLSNRAAGLLMGGIDDLKGRSFQGFDPSQLEKFQNPYNAQVRDATMSQLKQDQQVGWNQLDDRLAASSAFGDKRRGILEAETAGQFNRNTAQTLAGLNSEGFSQALAAAMAENQARGQYALGNDELITRLLAEFGSEGTTSGNSSGTGKSTGTSLGFSWTPYSGGMGR